MEPNAAAKVVTKRIDENASVAAPAAKKPKLVKQSNDGTVEMREDYQVWKPQMIESFDANKTEICEKIDNCKTEIGPAGYRINRDFARRGWAAKTGHPNWGPRDPS